MDARELRFDLVGFALIYPDCGLAEPPMFEQEGTEEREGRTNDE
jgi:hypothetical protein